MENRFAGMSFEEGLRYFADTVTRICMVHCGNEEDAKDCFQNVFIKLFQSEITFENKTHLKAWLIRVTINECNDWYRKGWNHKITLAEHVSPYMNLRKDQNEDHVLPYLMQLSFKYRRALYCFYYEDMKISEMAQEFQLAENTVKSHLSRGRKELESKMRESGRFHILNESKEDLERKVCCNGER